MTTLMFGSDNAVGVSAEVLAAIAMADEGYAVAYGDDRWSQRINAAYSAFFETETFVFPVGTGTAANALALATVTPPYGEILCHEQSHIYTTECGAVEFFSGGARLVPRTGSDARLPVESLKAYLSSQRQPNRHRMVPAAISVTQATEAGTVYSLDHLNDLAGIAHGAGMKVQMDGARFANALVALEATPAEMTWRAGIDVLSLGTTKNGTMNAEAVVVFNGDLARDLALRHKRAGLLTSKMRYVSAQLLTFVEDGFWLHNAKIANEAAQSLASIFENSSLARLVHPVETNQLFVEIDDEIVRALAKAGIRFRRWNSSGHPVYRLVTSFKTTDGEIEDLTRVLTASLAVAEQA